MYKYTSIALLKAKEQGWTSSVQPMRSLDEAICKAILDKTFWIALGTSLGWEKKKVVLKLDKMKIKAVGRDVYTRGKQETSYIKKTPNRWRNEWDKCIKYIQCELEVEDYFSDLLK